jgi:hypothetical protein
MSTIRKSEIIDIVERKFDECTHSYATENACDWYNLCGAQNIHGVWIKPHWRDIIIDAIILL